MRSIALVGCGHRGILGFLGSLKAIGREHAVEALCDTNPVRLRVAGEYLGHGNFRAYTNPEDVIADPDINTVIVATPGHAHADTVVTCLEAGKAVVCEKPVAITIEDCQRILEAADGHDFRVAFNFRYNAVIRRAKELIDQGMIGSVLSVQVRDIIGWQHGADYFRRWHRFSAQSGGLLLHKSTHSFDVVNWFLDDVPTSVFARAHRRFYVPERQRGGRCLDCPASETCLFHVDLNHNFEGQDVAFDEFYKKLYLDAEAYDGYVRDACVFAAESDIADTYDVSVRYRNGALLNYSAIFHAPYEDKRFILQGDRGRMEISRTNREIRVMFAPGNQDEKLYSIPAEAGGHGGADMNLMKALFKQNGSDIAFGPAEAGYWSVAIGACANVSIREGRDVPVPPLDSTSRASAKAERLNRKRKP